MKYAADFRQIAREALSGKWMIAVLVGLVASLLGGAGADGPELKLDIADPADEIIALAVVLTIPVTYLDPLRGVVAFPQRELN